MELRSAQLDSPVGPLFVTLNGSALCGLAFGDRWPRLEAFLLRRFGAPPEPRPVGAAALPAELSAYFRGEVGAIDRIEVDAGGSGFQAAVWAELRRIPAGTTVSYQELAARVGHPTAARAVATANAANPVAIVVPCHRVIHADGTISGYGGGVERKRWLLQHEAAHTPFRLGC